MPAIARQDLPDPLMSANVYCRDYLDDVLRRVVAPLRDHLRSEDADGASCVWTVRYRKCGEHLKVRAHAPAERRTALSKTLEALVSRLFADLGPPAAAAAERSGAEVAPIDLQDEASTDYPDRTLLFTDYRRSFVTLGSQLLFDQDGYAALMTRCLGAGCDVAIAALSTERVDKGSRQNALLKAAIDGLGALDLAAEERTEYLVYHRDWLIRFAVDDPARQTEVMVLFENRSMGGSADLGRIAMAHWNDDVPPPAGASGALGRALAALRLYMRGFDGSSASCTDPFARDPSHPPIFKGLHGLANQLGLSMPDEAFTYHMLLRSTAGDGVGTAVESRRGEAS